MERLYHQVSLRRAPQIRQLRVINYIASAGPNSNSKKHDRTCNEAETATGCVNANYDQRRLNYDTAEIRRRTRADRSQFRLRQPYIKSNDYISLLAYFRLMEHNYSCGERMCRQRPHTNIKHETQRCNLHSCQNGTSAIPNYALQSIKKNEAASAVPRHQRFNDSP